MRIIAITIMLFSMIAPAVAESNQSKIATLYKRPNCSCCDGHADHLRKNGFKVKIIPTRELEKITSQAGIPEKFHGCHTTFIDGYAISGHVPVSAIKKLLSERPKVKGISLPGMPVGTPGMPGKKDGPWHIYSIGDKKAEIYMTE